MFVSLIEISITFICHDSKIFEFLDRRIKNEEDYPKFHFQLFHRACLIILTNYFQFALDYFNSYTYVNLYLPIIISFGIFLLWGIGEAINACKKCIENDMTKRGLGEIKYF